MPSEKHELIITLIDHVARREEWEAERGVRTIEGVQPDLRLTKWGFNPIHLEVQTNGTDLVEKIDQCKKAKVEPLIIDGRKYNLRKPIREILNGLKLEFKDAVVPFNSPKKFTTTIKKKYWDQKMIEHKEKGYFIEYKQDSKYWRKRLNKITLPTNGVFLVGQKVYKVAVLEIYKRDTKEVFLDPPPEIPTDKCWCIKCVLNK